MQNVRYVRSCRDQEGVRCFRNIYWRILFVYCLHNEINLLFLTFNICNLINLNEHSFWAVSLKCLQSKIYFETKQPTTQGLTFLHPNVLINDELITNVRETSVTHSPVMWLAALVSCFITWGVTQQEMGHTLCQVAVRFAPTASTVEVGRG